MRRLIATIALLALVDTSVAIAQTVGFAKTQPHHLLRRTRPKQIACREAPVGPPPSRRRPIKCPRREKPDG